MQDAVVKDERQAVESRLRAGAVVLGMGRSGTSVITRALTEAGFYGGLPGELMAPNHANVHGYFEHMSVYAVNEEILRELGGSWFAAPPDAAQIAARGWALPRLREVLEGLLLAAGSSPLVLKDPRI